MTGRLETLIDAGMSAAEARRKADWFGELERLLGSAGGDPARARGWWVPGRIEFLGKHTDYAGGRSLVCAIERGLCVLASPREDNRVRMHDLRSGEAMECAISPSVGSVPGHWSNYVITVVRRVARNFPGLHRGADIAFASDLPQAAGMSSSSALVVAAFLVVSDINELASRQEYRRNIRTADDLAGYLGAVENGSAFADLGGDAGTGTSGGSQDHAAILRSRPGALVQYAFAPLRFEQAIALPDDFTFVIASSGVAAEKTGAARRAYNRCAAAAATILQQWNRATGRQDCSLGAAVDSEAGAADRIRALIRTPTAGGFDAPALVDRFEQFQTENSVVIPAVADALSETDLVTVGAMVDVSQQCAERLLGNQVPETIALARSARSLGAVAASAFGAGFGGSVWALVPTADTEPFALEWARTYRRAFPVPEERSEFFPARAGPPATRV